MSASIHTYELDITRDSLDEIRSCFIAFDLETTGLDPNDDAIIEIGAVRFENGIAVSSYSSLINAGVPVSSGAYAVNHISDEMLQAEGRKPEIAYAEFVDFIADAFNGKATLCAHNAAKFDIPFLVAALNRYGYSGSFKFVDTWSLAKKYIRYSINGYSLAKVASHYDITNNDAHRALSDADTCGQILARLLDEKSEQFKSEQARQSKHQLTDAESEVYAILINIFRSTGCSTREIGIYKNSSGYINVLDENTRKVYLKIKLAKRKSYIIIPGDYDSDYLQSEDCTKTEGEDNIRILFNNPFELETYADVFGEIYRNLEIIWLAYKNETEEDYMSDIDLGVLSENDLKRHWMNAKTHWNHEGQWIDSFSSIVKSRPSGYVASPTRGIHAAPQRQENDTTAPSPSSDQPLNHADKSVTSDITVSLVPRVQISDETGPVSTIVSASKNEPTYEEPVTPEQPEAEHTNPNASIETIDDSEPFEDEEEIQFEEWTTPRYAQEKDNVTNLRPQIKRPTKKSKQPDIQYPEWLQPIMRIINKIPGFRTMTPWKMIIAIIGYFLIFQIIMISDWGTADQANGILILWINRVALLAIFICYIDLFVNRKGFMSHLPLIRSKNILLRIIGYCLAFFIIPFFWALIAVIIQDIIT